MTDHDRTYGSPDRIEWIREHPCLACGATPSDNAHVATGGMGRKADYWQIVPLCARHHRESHRIGAKTFGIKYDLDLHSEAARIDRDWQRHLTSATVARNVPPTPQPRSSE